MVVVLSDAQPGDIIEIQQLGIDYNDDSPSREISHAEDFEEWPEIICSGYEGSEETGRNPADMNSKIICPKTNNCTNRVSGNGYRYRKPVRKG